MQWVAAVTGADLAVDAPELSRTPSDLTRAHEWLRSGEVLCALANAIRPGSVGKVARSGQGGAGAKPFRQMENIAQYLDACAAVGVPAHDLFRTVDLFEGSSMRQVVRNLHSLGRVAQSVAGFGGPHLGARLATRTQRSPFGPIRHMVRGSSVNVICAHNLSSILPVFDASSRRCAA